MKIQTISDINTTTKEGKLLLATIVKLSTESQSNKSENEIIRQCNIIAQWYNKYPLIKTIQKVENE